jgi:hypothetical protein
VQLYDGTSTSKVCMFQTDITRDCGFQMALLLHTCVCFKNKSRASPAVIWNFEYTRVYISNRHEAVRSFHMALLLHKAICFKQKLRVSLAVRWVFYFTSVYISSRKYAWEQMPSGTSISQVRIFQTDITRECSSQMELQLPKCVCYKQTSRVSAAVRCHFYFTSVYVSDRHEAWVHLSDGSYHPQACMFQTRMRRCAALIWHFYCTSVYVANRHHAWVQLSDDTSTPQVYML